MGWVLDFNVIGNVFKIWFIFKVVEVRGTWRVGKTKCKIGSGERISRGKDGEFIYFV